MTPKGKLPGREGSITGDPGPTAAIFGALLLEYREKESVYFLPEAKRQDLWRRAESLYLSNSEGTRFPQGQQRRI